MTLIYAKHNKNGLSFANVVIISMSCSSKSELIFGHLFGSVWLLFVSSSSSSFQYSFFHVPQITKYITKIANIKKTASKSFFYGRNNKSSKNNGYSPGSLFFLTLVVSSFFKLAVVSFTFSSFYSLLHSHMPCIYHSFLCVRIDDRYFSYLVLFVTFTL